MEAKLKLRRSRTRSAADDTKWLTEEGMRKEGWSEERIAAVVQYCTKNKLTRKDLYQKDLIEYEVVVASTGQLKTECEDTITMEGDMDGDSAMAFIGVADESFGNAVFSVADSGSSAGAETEAV